MASPRSKLNNSQDLREWHFKTNGTDYDLSEVYLNGTIVFKKSLVLYLPEPTTAAPINLTDFILNNPDYSPGSNIITVFNDYIQPTIITGDLNNLEVELINNGEIQGYAAGEDALIITTPASTPQNQQLKLINNGWIRGAGGEGGKGGDGSSSTKSVGDWAHRATYDDGGPYGGTSSSCVVDQSFYNRFWKAAGGPNSGAWVTTDCNTQEYFDTSTQPVWGDQGPTHENTSGSRMREGIEIVVVSNQILTGGTGGAGGQARSFQIARTDGANGTNATVTGVNPGFNPSTGYNYTLTVATDHGGDGGNGGDWHQPGTDGLPSVGGNAGASGGNPGNGINNINLLHPDSILGNYE